MRYYQGRQWLASNYHRPFAMNTTSFKRIHIILIHLRTVILSDYVPFPDLLLHKPAVSCIWMCHGGRFYMYSISTGFMRNKGFHIERVQSRPLFFTLWSTWQMFLVIEKIRVVKMLWQHDNGVIWDDLHSVKFLCCFKYDFLSSLLRSCVDANHRRKYLAHFWIFPLSLISESSLRIWGRKQF